MSDGSSYEMRHPELAIVRRREVVIALPQIRDQACRAFAPIVIPLHITRIEPSDSSVAKH